MEARATARNVRMSARKARKVLDLIRGKNVVVANAYLDTTTRRAVPVIQKLLKSAMSNAELKNDKLDVETLVVKQAFADEGATLKRFQPRAMGRGARINKRTTHITLILEG